MSLFKSTTKITVKELVDLNGDTIRPMIDKINKQDEPEKNDILYNMKHIREEYNIQNSFLDILLDNVFEKEVIIAEHLKIEQYRELLLEKLKIRKSDYDFILNLPKSENPISEKIIDFLESNGFENVNMNLEFYDELNVDDVKYVSDIMLFFIENHKAIQGILINQ